MAINPLIQRKTTISNMPGMGKPQGTRPQRADFALPGTNDDKTHEMLQKNVEKLVGQTFFATLLKQMHESPFKSDLFSGGRGEQAFQPMYDTYMSQHMTRGAGAKLVRTIVRRFEKRAKAAYEQQEREQMNGGSHVSTYR